MYKPEELQAIAEEAIRDFCRANGNDPMLEPINYLLGIGGKRMRPALVLLAADLFGADVRQHVHTALAVEVFHNFTLMHDDIMDRAPLRRGKETVHEKWDTNTAILSGDAMLIQAYELLCKQRSAVLPDLLQEFNTSALGVCKGQQLDMSFEQRMDVSIEEYIEMIRLKTAVLLGGALRLGAISAGASPEDVQSIGDFGEQLGISFQLRDDYLDAFGDPEKFGKQVGGDILADKKTFLLIRAFEKGGASEREQLSSYIGSVSDPEEKVRAVRSLMQQLGVDDEVLTASEQYYHQALLALDSVNCPEERKLPLRMLAQFLLERES